METIYKITRTTKPVPEEILEPNVDQRILEKLGWRIEPRGNNNLFLFLEGEETISITFGREEARQLSDSVHDVYVNSTTGCPLWVEHVYDQLVDANQYMEQTGAKTVDVLLVGVVDGIRILTTALQQGQANRRNVECIPLETVTMVYRNNKPIAHRCGSTMTVLTSEGIKAPSCEKMAEAFISKGLTF
ncbi:hypothetical protein [Thioalkalivibrio sp. ALE19]|uniref:hypothetical protein n=1 Tax=Thioalkalivibrio sp. ALE19 TaxID=1266909 RepID=UPI00048F3F19|nr:hypothetical protein [Thioalkalivibrio sp. ALE19]